MVRRLLFATVFLTSVLGCSSTMREGGRQAAAGAFAEAEAWWATKKPEIVAAARENAAEIAERVAGRVEATIEAKAEAAREKQRQGLPLSDEDKLYLYLAIGAPFVAAIAKAGMRYLRGDSAAPSVPPST
jgi:hypothetical protein